MSLKFDWLRQELNQTTFFNILMNILEKLADDLSFSRLINNFLMQNFLIRILYDVLYSHYFLFEVAQILNVFAQKLF